MFEPKFEKKNIQPALEQLATEKIKKITPISETLNTLRSEHLKEGVAPIKASVLSAKDYVEFAKNKDSKHAAINMVKIMQEGIEINYYGEPEELRSSGMINPEKKSYVISDCDSRDKWSLNYKSCVGTIMVGSNKEGKNISSLSHQDFKYILNNPAQFNEDMRQSIKKLVTLTEEGTRDFVIFGGKRWFPKEYLESIVLLGKICREEMGFNPVVISGPIYRANYPAEVYFENDSRRMFLVRPKEEENSYLQSFLASEIEKQPWYEEFKVG